jgi:Flp pilus assembly pilin Flp
MYRMAQLLKRLMVEENGQGITEYALILGLVVLALFIAVTQSNIGGQVNALFARVGAEVAGCTSGSCP